MSSRHFSLLTAVIVCVLAAGVAPVSAIAQTIERPVVNGVRASTAPTIDGALDEAAWRDAAPAASFLQADPFEGVPATEQTEVRILYDDEAIYIGATLFDSDPTRIVTTDTRRDAVLTGQDAFLMVFDTFHDLQNGFVFGTNAAGVEYDGQVRNQGDITTTWDGSWEVRTQVGERSWTAEFRIPLRTLRYGPAPQRWGVNFRRNTPRHREISYWSPMQRIFDLNRLSQAGTLAGMQLPTPRNIKLLPYATGSALRDYVARRPTLTRGDWGLDAKVGITPSLNLDLTYNTDFAQVEVDTQQINLTRFNLRFPERRPFFLENSGLFRVGFGNEVDLFFTRRIGLDANGGLVPIVAGGRMSGRVGNVNVGLLNMQTDTIGNTPSNNFTVARLNREFGNRSSLGAMFVNRNATGDLAGADDYNRTFGVSGAMGIGELFTVDGFGAKTQTPGRTGRDFAYNANLNYRDVRHRGLVEYGVTGEDFNPEVGFLSRSGGYRRYRFGFWETLRQERVRKMGFREMLPHLWYRRYDRLDSGGLLNAELHSDYYWDWENGNYIASGLMGTWEGLDRPFEIYPGVILPPGEHGGLRLNLEANSDQRKWYYGRLAYEKGRFFTGNQNSPTVQLVFRNSGSFMLDTTWEHRAIELPQGNFVTNLGNMRVTYNFTPLIFVQSLVQYNDRTDRWSTNLRFHWLDTAATGLFIVYNNTEGMNGFGPVNRTFIIKYVRQFDLLR